MIFLTIKDEDSKKLYATVFKYIIENNNSLLIMIYNEINSMINWFG